jgi:adenosine deaminase
MQISDQATVFLLACAGAQSGLRSGAFCATAWKLLQQYTKSRDDFPGEQPLSERFLSLPKAEIHIHLEGCFESDEIVRLAEQNGAALLRPREQLLDWQGGLGSFLEFLDWICSLVRTKDQLAQSAYSFAQRMHGSGVRYADVIVNPTHWRYWRRNLVDMIDGLDAGFKAAEQDQLPCVGLCVSLLRTQTAAEAIELVDLLATMRHPRVVALSIDGNEAAAGRTGARFADAFRKAGVAGLKRTVHAGESSGAEGVWDAIELLHADRIDHGIRAIEDPRLVAVLAERRIPLDICPSSNVRLGLYPSLADHPIEKLRKAGVPVSVNTDDPALLGLRLEIEYKRCAETFGWSPDDCREMAKNSVTASFADAAVKSQIISDIAAWRI